MVNSTLLSFNFNDPSSIIFIETITLTFSSYNVFICSFRDNLNPFPCYYQPQKPSPKADPGAGLTTNTLASLNFIEANANIFHQKQLHQPFHHTKTLYAVL